MRCGELQLATEDGNDALAGEAEAVAVLGGIGGSSNHIGRSELGS